MATTTPKIVDIHTHIYPPSYIELLKSRSEIPYIRAFPPSKDLKLVILPAEDTESTSRGRPGNSHKPLISPSSYYNESHKD